MNGIVHAGVPFYYPTWNDFVDDINDESQLAIDAALWDRHVFLSPREAIKLPDIDFVIHGHNGVDKPYMIHNRVWIDTKDNGNPIQLVSAESIINNKL